MTRALLPLLLALLAHPPARGSASLIFVTRDADSDVLTLLRAEHGVDVKIVPSADAALRGAAAGDTILFLADDYPHTQLPAPVLAAAADDRGPFWRQAAAKKVKVFLEFPSELPRNATPSPRPIKLKAFQTLRPTTGAQPAAYQGVLAPRLPPAVAAGWARVGMPPLGIFMHQAAQSTLPESWPIYATQYCHSRTNDSLRPIPPCPKGWWEGTGPAKPPPAHPGTGGTGTCNQVCPANSQHRDVKTGHCLCGGSPPNDKCMPGETCNATHGMCTGSPPLPPPPVDCSIETGAVIRAHSTIAAGFDTAVFGIDMLTPPVVPHPSAPGIGNV